MVTYSVKAINVILLPVCQVQRRPIVCTLWHFPQDCLGKMEYPDHPDEGYANYMMMQVEYALYSTTPWMDLNKIGKYFIVPTAAITNTDHKSKEEKITRKEGPARHLTQYANRPLPAV